MILSRLAATSQPRSSAISRTAVSVRQRSAQRLRRPGESHSREKKLAVNRFHSSVIPGALETPARWVDRTWFDAFW